MKQLDLRFLLTILLAFFVLSGLPFTVQARGTDTENSVILSAGGGIFYPFEGKSGYNAVVQATGKASQQERLGVEFEYRNYETELFNAKDIDTQSYILRIFGQYFFLPNGISPYVGLGLNLAVNVFDEDEIERKRSSINIKQGWGIGYGIMGLFGLEVPVGGGVAFFGEGRVSGDFQISSYKSRSGNNKLRFESLSGLTGMGGVRLRF